MIFINILEEREAARGQGLGLVGILVGFRNTVLIGGCPVFQVVNGEGYLLRLAGRVGRGQGIGMGEVQFRQPLRLRQELPITHLTVNSCVKNHAQEHNNNGRYEHYNRLAMLAFQKACLPFLLD